MKWELGIAFAVLSVLAAHAQNSAPQTSPQFSAILRAQQHRDAVLGAAKQSTSWIRLNCQKMSFIPLPLMRIWKPLEFDSNGAPTAGVWGETLEASGCGTTKKLNVVTIVRGPRQLVTGVLAPGDTSADPVLQKDAWRYVYAAAKVKVTAPGCQQAFVDNTQAVRKEEPTDAQLTGPILVENWTVVACGQTVVVEVKFLPTANGTTIGAHAL